MEYASVEFANVGPIEAGTIHKSKLAVFIGPSNSGKTTAAKIMHGVCQMDERSPGPQYPAETAPTPAADAAALVRHAGLRPGSVPMQGKKASAVAVRGAGGHTREFDLAAAAEASPAGRCGPGDARRSVYLPAARADGVRYILDAARGLAKVAQLQAALDGMRGAAVRGRGDAGGAAPAAGLDELLADLSLGDLSCYAWTVLDAMKGGLGDGAWETFSRLFPGTAGAAGSSGAPPAAGGGPAGRLAWIEPAGAGAASLLPVAAGIHRVEAGGACVVEGPELHLDPQRQLGIVDEMLRVAGERRISVVVTTQSDFLVQKVLSLVSSGRLDRSDLGLYYFRRPEGGPARIQRLRVEETGEAEQEMFTRAMDSLIEGF